MLDIDAYVYRQCRVKNTNIPRKIFGYILEESYTLILFIKLIIKSLLRNEKYCIPKIKGQTVFFNSYQGDYSRYISILFDYVLKKKIGPIGLTRIGEGGYGVVYIGSIRTKNKESGEYIKETHTFKYTTDIEEIKLWEYLLKNKNPYPYFCTVYDVVRVYSKGRWIGGIINKEYITNFNSAYNQEFMNRVYSVEDAINMHYKEAFMLAEYPVEIVMDFVNTYLDIPENIDLCAPVNFYSNAFKTFYDNKNSISNAINTIKQKFDWATIDTHPCNWGFDDGGNFKIFDITGWKSN